MSTSQENNTNDSRPRSATSPVSSSHASMPSTGIDRSRCYNFTDEPGYFRPASPLIDRQFIEEDLEMNIKYACTLLSHSIERGIPSGPSYESQQFPKPPAGPTDIENSRVEPLLGESHTQFDNLFPSKGMDLSTEARKDSGVGLSFQSSGKSGKAYRASFSGTAGTSANMRFYGNRASSGSYQVPSSDRGRSRGQSVDAEKVSRSRSSSPSLFPYSPPQLGCQWTVPGPISVGFNAREPEAAREFKETTPFFEDLEANLGAAGMTWLCANIETEDDESSIPFPAVETEYTPRTSADKLEPISRTGFGPARNRFYSARWSHSSAMGVPETSGRDTWYSRDSSISRSPSSARSFSPANAQGKQDWSPRYVPPDQGWPDRKFSGTYHTDLLKHHETVYSAIPTDDQPRNRRRRASNLLKKLTGLGRRKASDPIERGRTPQRAMQTCA
ncbi:hypothetical protein N7474_001995 [Penicillium riverlandense]|uniref:uncharacterized protein n=1 Tax=Penicillium riverlandense TaxID=1903569 RepID=UPI0025490061|nr:uncharacterized protein N7474_001995 [Penicillium riverlandense]KAJ5833684.1 hypothetical protein N7474_001995 [Penicillium riverlandense]